MKRSIFVLAALACLIGGLFPATPALAQVELCLAVDGSSSIPSADFDLQLEGVAQAIQSPSIVPTDGTVTISVVQFSTDVTLQVPPTVIDSAATANAIAAQVRAISQKNNATNTADAINLCVAQGFTFHTSKQVIDISTDGVPTIAPGAASQDQAAARAAALSAANAAIANGVDAINTIGVGGVDEAFLRELVRPQPASSPPDDGFVITVDTFQEYIDAMKNKIRIEVQPEEECCICECLFADTHPSLWALEIDPDGDGVFDRRALLGVFWFKLDFSLQEAQEQAETLVPLLGQLGFELNLPTNAFRLLPWYLPNSPAWASIPDLEALVKSLKTLYKSWDFDSFILVDIWKPNWRHLCGTHIRADIMVDCDSGQLEPVDPNPGGFLRQTNTTELCLALDGSDSIEPAEFTLQLEGVAQAIENPGIVPRDGSATISVVQFSSSVRLEVAPTVIDSTATANSVAAAVRAIQHERALTNTGGAIDMCTQQGFSYQSGRQVIDISTDGAPSSTTQNPNVVDQPTARQFALNAANAAMAGGVDAVNVLGVGREIDQAFLGELVRPQPASSPPDDGFVIVVDTFQEYVNAMIDKIKIEVEQPSEPCDCIEYVGSFEWTTSFLQVLETLLGTSVGVSLPNLLLR